MDQQLTFIKNKYLNPIQWDLKSYSHFGTSTQTKTIDGVPYFFNEFWTSRQRQACRIHEISYRACFKPQLPGFFIERLTEPGDVVYDPFMGRGTTPIEAALRGRIPYGNDINPLSKALTEPRIHPPSLDKITCRLNEIPWRKFTNIKKKDLLVFYHPQTLAQIEGLRLWLIKRQAENKMDSIDLWIRMLALNRLTGHSSGFFSVWTLPPNQTVSIKRQQKINEKSRQKAPLRNVPEIIIKKSKALLSQDVPYAERHLFLTKPAHKTSQVPSGSVKLIVTSPPFLDVVDYELDNWLRCWFLDIPAKTIKITRLKNIEHWQNFISLTLQELSRVVCRGGHIAFEVGEVRGGSICLEKNVILAAKGLPLETLCVLIHQQKFTKTANCWGIENNKKGTNSNRIVLFRRK